jgi:hypothetical protein
MIVDGWMDGWLDGGKEEDMWMDFVLAICSMGLGLGCLL